MGIFKKLINAEEFLHSDDGDAGNMDIEPVSDEKLLQGMNDFIKDGLLSVFLKYGEIFNRKLGLDEIEFEYDYVNHNVVNLKLSDKLKAVIKSYINREELLIKIKL